MSWDFESGRPIFIQLIEMIGLRIITGKYPCGSRLPAVRELAQEAAVNPNTMQKALAELERNGLVFSQRTSGRFITEDAQMIEQLRENMAREQITAFVEKMRQLGLERKQIAEIMLSDAEIPSMKRKEDH